jgi:trimeric autotransporter adhesin
LAASNYNFTNLVTGTLTINKAPLTVTANNAIKTYGDANPVLSTTVSGFVNGETLATSGVSGSGAASTTANATTGAGSATITAAAGTLAASNYNFTNLVNGTLTINQRPLTVIAESKTKNYGEVNPALSYSVAADGVGTSRGLVNADTLSGGLTTTANQASGAGSYTIDASALSNGNYLVTANNGTLTINKAPLTVTANNAIKTYGDANPVLGTTVSGFVNGETLATSGVSGSGAASTSANATTGAGSATITAAAGTLAASNYNFTNLVNGTLTINQRPLTVTAEPKTKNYGEVNPALSYSVAADGVGTSRGLVNADTLSGSLTTTATQASGAGSYSIDASALSNGNYLVTANNGTLTINKAHLTVTANNALKTYGDANPVLGTTVSGFVNGETLATSGVSGAGAASTSANATTGAGSATITAAAGTLAASNYDFPNLVNGTLTINKAPLTVTANNAIKTYGDANPVLGTTVSGFVNGETLATSGVSGTGAASTSANATTGAGSATITAAAGTLTASNYDFPNLVSGTLTINKAPLTVTANNAFKTYGDANPVLGTTVSGFVNGETLATSGVSGTGAASTSANATTSAGSATITATSGTLAASNYNFTNLVNGTLTINQRPLTVIAEPKTKNYGEVNPALSYSVAADGVGTSRGLVNADTLSGSLTTTANQASGAGSYTIDASALSNGNYLVTANNGTLTINKAPLTVTANNAIKTYGDANPVLGTTVSGFVNGETLATSGVSGSGAASTTANATTGAGSATITAAAGTLAASNYNFTNLVNGTLTINQRPLTVTAEPKTKNYGEVNPALSYSVAADGVGTSRGLVNADTLSGSLTTTANQASGAGSYTIDASALSNGNYLVTANNGTLTINKAPLTVTANNAIKTYGDTNPVLGTTVSGFVNGETLATSGVSGSGAASTSANATTGAGSATITAAAGTLAASNYNFTNLVNGTLTINPRPLTVTAEPKTKNYGEVNPALSYSVAADGIGTSRGLANGDTLSGGLTTTANQASGAGSYTIDASALSNGNYLVTANNGTLTISFASNLNPVPSNKAPISITLPQIIVEEKNSSKVVQKIEIDMNVRLVGAGVKLPSDMLQLTE